MTKQRFSELVALARNHELNRRRPEGGFCYLDFLDHWLQDAIWHKREDDVYKWAREIAHIYMLHSPEYAPMPRNVMLGED